MDDKRTNGGVLEIIKNGQAFKTRSGKVITLKEFRQSLSNWYRNEHSTHNNIAYESSASMAPYCIDREMPAESCGRFVLTYMGEVFEPDARALIERIAPNSYWILRLSAEAARYANSFPVNLESVIAGLERIRSDELFRLNNYKQMDSYFFTKDISKLSSKAIVDHAISGVILRCDGNPGLKVNPVFQPANLDGLYQGLLPMEFVFDTSRQLERLSREATMRLSNHKNVNLNVHCTLTIVKTGTDTTQEIHGGGWSTQAVHTLIMKDQTPETSQKFILSELRKLVRQTCARLKDSACVVTASAGANHDYMTFDESKKFQEVYRASATPTKSGKWRIRTSVKKK